VSINKASQKNVGMGAVNGCAEVAVIAEEQQEAE
jgi:hypothetical protein